ncbi:MAG: lysylphosphatidylglycerol synthase transmembrane domain-containing protein [Bacteroidota bacterium]
MQPNRKNIVRHLSLRKVWLPIVLGIGIVCYLVLSDPALKADQLRRVQEADGRYIMLAFLSIMVRDLGYMYRIRVLTQYSLSWLATFYVVVLWEFSAATTPFVIGGGIVAAFLLAKEGVKPGKAIAYIMLTTIFDNLFFVLAASPGLVGMYRSIFQELGSIDSNLENGLRFVFWLSYLVVSAYTLVVAWALFVTPKPLQALLSWCAQRFFVKRWRAAADQYATDIVVAAGEMQRESLGYWLKVGLTTVGIWSARYVVLNLIMMAYVPLSLMDHIRILGKQIILWTTMLFSPLPGSSGTTEFFFKHLCQGTLGHYTLITGVVWRLMTYYIYLLLGAMILPRWLKRMFYDQGSPAKRGKAENKRLSSHSAVSTESEP